MRFIDPTTKTNWKYLAIVAFVAVVVAVGEVFLLRTMEPTFSPPMETVTISPCDVNTDGQCDAADYVLFQEALGKHRGDLGYNPFADADADGVITAVDQQMLFPVTSPAPQPQTLDTSTGSTSLTTSWQTYRNDEFGFEVKYPVTYEVDRGSSKLVQFIWPNHSFIDIEVIPTEKSMDEYINEYIEAGKTGFEGKPSLGVHRRLTVTVSDRPAIQLEVSYPAIPAAGIATYLEVTDGSLIRFGITDWSDSQDFDSLRKVYDQILSTFRFVEPIDK